MKKQTAFLGAILSLIPLLQPLIIKSGVVLSTTGLMLALPQKAKAESFQFYFDRGYEKAEKGDYYGAISDYTKAIEINPQNAKAYYNRGFSKSNLKDYYGAISDYTKAIEINPKLIDAYFNRSMDKEKIGDIKGACFDAKKVVSLGDEDSNNESWIRNNC